METKNIYQKLTEVKKDIGAIEKTSKNNFFHNSYFDINALLAVVEPALLKNGLIVLQPILEGAVHSVIIDVDTREELKSSMMLSDIKDPQKLGSEITYFRRYTLQSLLSLQAEDDDGNTASKAKQSPKETKEELRLNTMAFSKVKEFIKDGGDISRPLKTYIISKEVETALYGDS